jgi:hypothetical protein
MGIACTAAALTANANAMTRLIHWVTATDVMRRIEFSPFDEQPFPMSDARCAQRTIAFCGQDVSRNETLKKVSPIAWILRPKFRIAELKRLDCLEQSSATRRFRTHACSKCNSLCNALRCRRSALQFGQ